MYQNSMSNIKLLPKRDMFQVYKIIRNNNHILILNTDHRQKIYKFLYKKPDRKPYIGTSNSSKIKNAEISTNKDTKKKKKTNKTK